MASNNRAKNIITIDGPAGAGKSTVAKEVAKALHYFYLDTGAMYRALTLKALKEKVNLDDEEELYRLAKETHIDLQDTIDGMRVLLDHVDVSEKIRSVEVTNNTSQVASQPKVREVMVEWQRRVASQKDVVIEGRDTGTVVFPQASYKFYIDADLAERARRRSKDLKEAGTMMDEEALIHQINERDYKDMHREVGALKKAEDAISIDSTGLNVHDVASQILQIISKHE